MKRLKWNIRKVAVLAICLIGILVNASFAKTSEKGFRTVESNDKTEKYTIVRFYDDKQNLVYEEKIAGIVLALTTKNKQILDKTLALFIKKQLITAQVQAKKLVDNLN